MEYIEAPMVRGETRHSVPLSLPRTPLFPGVSAVLMTAYKSGIAALHLIVHGL